MRHLITSWGDRTGATHRRCTCGAGTPAPGIRPEVVEDEYVAANHRADAYVAACRQLAGAAGVLDVVDGLVAGDVMHGDLELAAWLLAALAGSDGRPASVDSASGGSPEPAAPESVVAAPAPADPPPCDPTAGQAPAAEAVSEPPAAPTRAGYRRVWWITCGHSLEAPTRHDWAHRHPCPICRPDAGDHRCPGVPWVNPRHDPPAPPPALRCQVCGASPAALYPGGALCDPHSPWATAGRPDPRCRPGPVRLAA